MELITTRVAQHHVDLDAWKKAPGFFVPSASRLARSIFAAMRHRSSVGYRR